MDEREGEGAWGHGSSGWWDQWVDAKLTSRAQKTMAGGRLVRHHGLSQGSIQVGAQ